MRRHFRRNYKIELSALCPYLCFWCHLQLFSYFLSQVNMHAMICRGLGRSKCNFGPFPCYFSVILFFFLISYQLSDPAAIYLAIFIYPSGSCQNNGSKDSLCYFVHSFNIFAFLFILVQLEGIGNFSVYVSALRKETLIKLFHCLVLVALTVTPGSQYVFAVFSLSTFL